MLGENIKKLRVTRGLNQVNLGNKLGVSKQCVSNWENGNIQPSVDMLVRLAEYFNTSTDCLLGRDEQKSISVEGLSDDQVDHVKLIVKDLRNSNLKE